MVEFSIVWFILYFVPSAIAVMRKMHNVGPVIVVNLFFGWTIIGWIVALAMSVAANKKPPFVTTTGNLPPPKN